MTIIAIIISFISFHFFSSPTFNLKYHIPNSECYISDLQNKQTNKSEQQQEQTILSSTTPTTGVIIFEFHGPLLFINVERFKTKFQKLITQSIRCQYEKSMLAKNHHSNSKQKQCTEKISVENDTKKLACCCYSCSSYCSTAINMNNESQQQQQSPTPTLIKTVIIDMNRIPYLDSKGVECLIELEHELRKNNISTFTSKSTPTSTNSYSTAQNDDNDHHNIRLYLAGISRPVFDTMLACRFFNKFNLNHCFLTVHDAVMHQH